MAKEPGEQLKTSVITNFGGNLVRTPNGDMNSGNAKYSSHGYNPYLNPRVLSFMEQARDITGAVVTDLIVAFKTVASANEAFSFALGNTGRIYQITANNPGIENPDYDTVTLITTLVMYTVASRTNLNVGDNVTSPSGGVGTIQSIDTSNNTITINVTAGSFPVGSITDTTTSTTTSITALGPPTFHQAASLELFGSPTILFIGHDTGVMSVVTDGTDQKIIGIASSWIPNVPRPLKIFAGSLTVGNRDNIALISAGIVTSYAKLSPSFPNAFNVADLDVSDDGVYLVVSAHTIIPGNIDAITPDTAQGSAGDSMLCYWNGSDTGITRFTTLPFFNLNGYVTFAQNEFMIGNDIFGSALYTPAEKILTLPFLNNPLPNAMSSEGNMMFWMAPEYSGGKLRAAFHAYGQMDEEYPPSHFRNLLKPAVSASADVMRIPAMTQVSYLIYGGKTSGYTNDIVLTGKIYFSTMEYDGSNTVYKLWAFSLAPTGSGQSIVGAVYQTQQQLFGKKVSPKEVRIYLEPVVSNISFQIDLIGIDGNVIADSSGLNVFTAGNPNLMTGQTLAWYNPRMNASPAIGIQITNLGIVTPYIHKIEVDPFENGK